VIGGLFRRDHSYGKLCLRPCFLDSATDGSWFIFFFSQSLTSKHSFIARSSSLLRHYFGCFFASAM
jgi:hypothetical protein